jgi:hypothetical protein
MAKQGHQETHPGELIRLDSNDGDGARHVIQ